MTDALEKVRALLGPPLEKAAKATPGPWRVDDRDENDEWWGKVGPDTLVIGPDLPVCATNDDGIPTVQEVDNAAYIAACDPATLTAIGEAVEALGRERDALTKAQIAREQQARQQAERDGAALQARVDAAEAALRQVDNAINPSDRDGISLHEWNSRLRQATTAIRAVIAPEGQK